jgi:hypothetical protein
LRAWGLDNLGQREEGAGESSPLSLSSVLLSCGTKKMGLAIAEGGAAVGATIAVATGVLSDVTVATSAITAMA